MTPPLRPTDLAELAGLAEAEDFFGALGVRYDPRVLASHRLQVLRRFGVAVEAFLRERPGASPSERRAALRAALHEAHDACAGGGAGGTFSPRGAGLVRLGRRG